MDRAFHETLRRGIEALSLPVDDEAVRLLERLADRLLAWNQRVNLTAITDPAQLAEKHFVDSLLLLPSLGDARTLLDIGSGAGLPGMAVACARRGLAVTCCDSVAKKVAFVKAVAVELGLDVRGVVARAGGNPAAEGLPLADAVVSRALADAEVWVPLGARYVAEGGVLLAMLGRAWDRQQLERLGERAGLRLVGLDRFELPVSGSQRAVARFAR
jgi:16S rRNA (guanine527-N7)-methyltransferase